MKKYRALYILIIAIYSSNLAGQPNYIISADVTSGCDSVEVNFTINPTSGISSAAWNLGNGQNSTLLSPTILYNSPGTYTATLIVNNSDSDSIQITVYETPTVNFSHKDTLGYFTVLFECQPQLQTGNYTYSWDYGDGETFIHDSLISAHRYIAAGTYNVSLQITNDAGCSASNSSVVEIVDPDSLQVQKVFSPNNDGINDLFTVETNGTSVYSLSIFTRSGALIYKSKAPFISWDGTNTSGIDVNEGIYFYKIEEITGTKSRNKVGYVYLFRNE